MKKYVYSISALVLFLLVLFGNPIVDARQKLFGEILSYIGFLPTDSQQEINALRAENVALRGELAIGTVVPEDREFRKANIYSTYPFNTRNEIIIDIGADRGITQFTPVTFEEKIFLGFVKTVNAHTSLVKTIFDGGVEVPVRIGDRGADALLKGGTTPRLTLIAKEIEIQKGDVIVTADSRFPFGLIVGTVKDIHDSATASFKEATIQTPYILTQLHSVYVIQ